MDAFVLDVPAMYGDHHVIEVRRILLEEAGVAAVEASSAFHVVEVQFDPERTSADALRKRLEDAGYLADLAMPSESGRPAIGREAEGTTYFRHSASREIAGAAMAFEQEIAAPARPLWPCPGVVPAHKDSPKEDD